jgi:hypothetical protein
MENIQLNTILGRDELEESFINTVNNIFAERNNPLAHRGVYVYGSHGSGKTEFVMRALKSHDFDVVRYDASDSRGKSTIETMTKQHMPEVNIMSMWNMKQKRIVIVMDEIEAMNSGDKGGINALTKLLRPKKTKKQRNEAHNYSPVVCIGNRHMDKKIGDLMRVCVCYELSSPSNAQIDSVIKSVFRTPSPTPSMRQKMIRNIGGDLRKLAQLHSSSRRGLSLDAYSLDNILTSSSCNEDAKRVVKSIINSEFRFKEHASMIGDADRTIVGLLWHENVVDVLETLESKHSLPMYLEILRCLCLGDFIDRNTFQKQVWQFNEMSSIIKTMKSHHRYHLSLQAIRDTEGPTAVETYNPSEVRFTRVLTKYSSEFNNFSFIQSLCQKLGVDRSDLEHIFLKLNETYEGQSVEAANLLCNYDIVKQEVDRMFKMLAYDGVKKTRRVSSRKAGGQVGDANDDEDASHVIAADVGEI